jgi:hypothetical protein
MFTGQFSENVRLLAVLQAYRIIADSIFAQAGPSCFQLGRAIMFPVRVMMKMSQKPSNFKMCFESLKHFEESDFPDNKKSLSHPICFSAAGN